MLSIEHHLEGLRNDVRRIEGALSDPGAASKMNVRGNAAELAASLVRHAGEVAALFVHRSVSPKTVPVGHGGPLPGPRLEA